MRIAQVCADAGIAPGSTKGAALHLRGMAAGLTARGHRVATYSRRTPEGSFPSPVAPLDALTSQRRGDLDLIYERYSLGHRGGIDVARRIGVPFVLEVNAPLVDEARRHRPATVGKTDALNESRLLEDADLVVAVSRDLVRWVEARRSGPTALVPNGFEPSWFPEPANTGAAGRPMVFLGHPKPWHGADRLIKLLVDIAGLGHRPDLLVIGGGRGAESLRSAATRAGIASQVHITGAFPPDRASRLLAQASIGLAPYPSQDPFYFCPLKVVDYLAAGLPVVSTRQGDIPGLVRDAGLLVEPEDAGGLARAVVALLEDPGRRAAMGASGRARAMSSLTWEHIAALVHQCIDQLALEPAGRP